MEPRETVEDCLIEVKEIVEKIEADRNHPYSAVSTTEGRLTETVKNLIMIAEAQQKMIDGIGAFADYMAQYGG